MSPETIDHAEIMRLIREGNAFRGRSPLPDADAAQPDGFRPAPPARPLRPEAPPLPAAVDTGVAFAPAPPPVEIDLDALRAEARAQGRAEAGADAAAKLETATAAAHAAGHAEAMAGAAASLDEARKALLAAARALTDAGDAAVARLFGALDAAVLRLASDRAGLAIDAHPAAFRARIETLAARLAAAGAATEIRLNPDDLAALGPGDTDLTLVADPVLARGDAVLRAGDVRLDDILAATAGAPQGHPRRRAAP